jgi:hypothetical protein
MPVPSRKIFNYGNNVEQRFGFKGNPYTEPAEVQVAWIGPSRKVYPYVNIAE